MKTIFVNVNTQEDFFGEDSKVKVPNVESIRPKLKALTSFAKENKIKVVNVISWYDPKNEMFKPPHDFNKTFPEHCVANTNGTNFIKETLPEDDYFLIKWDAPYIVFPEIHKHRNLIVFKNNINLIEGNKFADSVLNNLGTVLMDRPLYVVYGVGAGLVAKDLTRRGYNVKVITDATIEFNNIPLSYEEVGVEPITTEYLFSSELA
ncbi:MAG: cysteine hydrolase family protein [bacterium]|jgi:nicotinamidase-related amidase